MNDGRINTNSVRGNAFDKMEMSQELADRIAAMPEVRTANVMIAGKSAYVAVALDRADGGMHVKVRIKYVLTAMAAGSAITLPAC